MIYKRYNTNISDISEDMKGLLKGKQLYLFTWDLKTVFVVEAHTSSSSIQAVLIQKVNYNIYLRNYQLQNKFIVEFNKKNIC